MGLSFGSPIFLSYICHMFKKGILVKLRESEDPTHPDNIEIGRTVEGFIVSEPKVGKKCTVSDHETMGGLVTSTVQEIITKNDKFVVFRTHNSIYKLFYKDAD